MNLSVDLADRNNLTLQLFEVSCPLWPTASSLQFLLLAIIRSYKKANLPTVAVLNVVQPSQALLDPVITITLLPSPINTMLVNCLRLHSLRKHQPWQIITRWSLFFWGQCNCITDCCQVPSSITIIIDDGHTYNIYIPYGALQRSKSLLF
jgi:hypothetical protein